MSKLYEFKYECHRLLDIPEIYVILETVNNDTYLRVINNGKKSSVNITSKIEMLCDDISKINLSEWNNKKFISNVDFLPNTYWQLRIKTDTLTVYCSGLNMFPDNWDKFVKTLNNIGIII